MKLYYLLDDDDIIEKGDECLFKHSWIEVGEAAIGEKVFDAIIRRKVKPWCSMCGVELDGVYYVTGVDIQHLI
jgi:hypothetical protein